MEIHNNKRIYSKLDSKEKFLIYLYDATHLLDLLILWVFGWGSGAIFAMGIPSKLLFPMFLFLIISIFSIIFTYIYIIPRMQRKENPHNALFIIQIVLTCGAIIPSLLGLILGVIGFIEFDAIYWQISFTFILFGFGHSLFLHFFKIRPYLRTLEKV